jgi:hypothetical protein
MEEKQTTQWSKEKVQKDKQRRTKHTHKDRIVIFIQSYVNSNLHVSTLFILIIHKESNSESLKIVHLLASGTFNAPYFHYVIQTRT